jgi:pseudouridine synthase
MKTFTVDSKEPIRLNKYLSDSGIISRRKADSLISLGLVMINDHIAILGDKVKHKDVVTMQLPGHSPVYALYYKPRGQVTGKVSDLPGCEPVGRLDKESEGLLLYTNDYRVTDALLNPLHAREKEYEVVIREKATPRVETLLKKGIRTQEAQYAPVKDIKIYEDGHRLRIILTEGKKHEIRRMMNALNLTIVSLKRIRIMSFLIHGLTSGKSHMLSLRQVTTLLKELGLD